MSIKERIAKLLELKSIISLIVIISYTIMVYIKILPADYKDLVIMVVTYYFAKKDESKK